MKKLMIVFVATILILGTSFTGQAGTADEKYCTVQDLRGQAASGWHQTYQAHGRTVVVDIPIQVPDVNAIPAIKAVPMPAVDTIPLTDERGYLLEKEKVFNEAGFFRWDSIAGELKAEAARKNQMGSSGQPDVKSIVRLFNQLEWDSAYAQNTPSTVRDADKLMKTIGDKYFPSEEILLIPHWATVYADRQAPLMVYFDQVLRGIPLLGYSMNSFSRYSQTFTQEKRGYVGGVAIMQGLTDVGLKDTFYSMQYFLLKEQQEMEADLPLCSLEKVMSTYEQLIAEGKLRTVQSLRLGFVAWYNEREPESYSLLPTWVLEGDLFKNEKIERQRTMTQSSVKGGEYGPILVNAQTGELIDPFNASPDRSFNMPDIFTWK